MVITNDQGPRDLSLSAATSAGPPPSDLSLRRRGPLPAENELAHRRLGVADGAADLDEAGPGAVEPGLGQPGRRDAEQLGDLHWVQQGIDFVGLSGAAHGPPPLCLEMDRRCL